MPINDRSSYTRGSIRFKDNLLIYYLERINNNRHMSLGNIYLALINIDINKK